VTLTGFVRSYSQRYAAENDAKRVAGVAAVANDIEVRLPSVDQRPDPEIARDAVAAIQSDLPYSHQFVKTIVKGGWVTLEGEVEWNYLRERAENAVRRIKGVKGVSNMIQLKPVASPVDIKRKIEDAFKRSAIVDANHVTVETTGGRLHASRETRWAGSARGSRRIGAGRSRGRQTGARIRPHGESHRRFAR